MRFVNKMSIKVILLLLNHVVIVVKQCCVADLMEDGCTSNKHARYVFIIIFINSSYNVLELLLKLHLMHVVTVVGQKT